MAGRAKGNTACSPPGREQRRQRVGTLSAREPAVWGQGRLQKKAAHLGVERAPAARPGMLTSPCWPARPRSSAALAWGRAAPARRRRLSGTGGALAAAAGGRRRWPVAAGAARGSAPRCCCRRELLQPTWVRRRRRALTQPPGWPRAFRAPPAAFPTASSSRAAAPRAGAPEPWPPQPLQRAAAPRPWPPARCACVCEVPRESGQCQPPLRVRRPRHAHLFALAVASLRPRVRLLPRGPRAHGRRRRQRSPRCRCAACATLSQQPREPRCEEGHVRCFLMRVWGRHSGAVPTTTGNSSGSLRGPGSEAQQLVHPRHGGAAGLKVQLGAHGARSLSSLGCSHVCATPQAPPRDQDVESVCARARTACEEGGSGAWAGGRWSSALAAVQVRDGRCWVCSPPPTLWVLSAPRALELAHKT